LKTPTAPDHPPGRSAFSVRLPEVFHRPVLAVILALISIGVSVLLRELAIALPLTGIAQTSTVALATTLPLLAAGILIPRVTTSAGFATAVGLTRLRRGDIGIGVCAGLIVRAVTEVLAPTTGTVRNSLGGAIAPAILLSLIVAVAISPFVEELLFRGVLQRALSDRLRSSGIVVATGVSIAITTAVFVLAHVTTGQMQTGLLVSTIAVGVVCGLLTALSGRLTAAITAHTVHNLIGAALLLW